MAIKVKFLTKDEIEKDAELLLAEYEETIGEPIELPLPVADITTSHLALELGIADLHQFFDIPTLRAQPDILGAIFVEKRLVVIDQRLSPKDDFIGRYRFTVAHEIGHWRLHRYLAKNPHQILAAPSKPTVICRSSEKNEPIEWQANYFASCLLMPRRRVFEEWNVFLNDGGGTALAAVVGFRIMKHSQAMIYVQRNDCPGHDWACREVVLPIGERFGVTAQAMRIRLEELGLLPRQKLEKAA
jgi:Zn-dependent peptidase ImmA (M78 family)